MAFKSRQVCSLTRICSSVINGATPPVNIVVWVNTVNRFMADGAEGLSAMSDHRLNRRSILKGLAGAGAVAGVGGAGFLAATGGAAAAVELDVSIGDTTIANDEGDVDYVAVDVDKVLEWENFDVPLRYIGFRHEITLDDGGDTGWHVLYDNMSGRLTDWSSQGDGSDGWGGPGEYVGAHSNADHEGNDPEASEYTTGTAYADVSWAIISDGSHPAGYDSVQTPVNWTGRLAEAEDGTTTTHTVRWRTTLTFYTEDGDGNAVQVTDADGVPSVQGEDSFDVTVTNEAGGTTGSSETGSSTAG